MCALVETRLGCDSIGAPGHKSSRNDLKDALRQADRQQNAIRKNTTWNSELTAFEQPQPKVVPKETGVRNAIRRQTRKLKKTTSSGSPTALAYRPPPIFRTDSFDYGDELKRRPTQIHFAQPARPSPRPVEGHADAKAQLLNLKAHQRQRKAERKAAEKRTKEQEKAQRRALVQRVKQERFLEFLRALASRHPHQNIKRIRYEHKAELIAQQIYQPILPESWLENVRNPSLDLVSPVASPPPQSPYYPQRLSHPPSIPRWSDFSSKDELWKHLQGEQLQVTGSAHKPQELPAYERLHSARPRPQAAICEAPTDIPDRDPQVCKAKPNLVHCDVCSATVCLSGVFYSCSICGPRDGGIVCSDCQQDNVKCLEGSHDLESSMQVVQRISPASAWKAQKTQQSVGDVASKSSEQSEDSVALSRISADTASHSLCLATMQKKMVKVEAGIETQNKKTERLASWLEEAIEQQREQAADLTKSMLEEVRTERVANMNMIKRLSTKKKPRRQSLEGSSQHVPWSRENLRERELALREREVTLKEREMALHERRELAKERTEKPAPVTSPLPSSGLTSAPNQDNRVLHNVLTKLDRIEGLSAMSLRQAPSSNDKVVDQIIERVVGRLTLATTGIQEHAVKRKADSTGGTSSIQLTPVTGLPTGSFLQPPSRTMSRGNQEDDEEDDGHSPKRPKHQPSQVLESGRRPLLACPYSKLDFNRYSHRNVNELNYRGCSSCVLSDISRLKQHLYRVHQYPEHHCPRCFDDLITKEQLNTHLRDGCQAKECPYPEKFGDSSKLKKKWPRKSITECWYMVYKILFPGQRLPASPYAEDLATGVMATSVPNTPPRPLPTLSLSPEVLSDVVRRQLERHSITDPNQHAFLLSLVQDATTEALGLISASPTPITNSNPSSAMPQSGTHAASPGPDSALMRQEENANPYSAGTGTIDSTFDTFTNLQDLSSLGSGINTDIHVSIQPPTQAMSSNQSSGTFSNLSPLPGMEDLMNFDDDLVQLTSNEIMAPIKPSNSTRTNDSGYHSLMRNDAALDAYPLSGKDASTTGSSGSRTENASSDSRDSLLDPETYERLMREHGDDFGMNLGLDLGHGTSGTGTGDVFASSPTGE